MGEARIGITGGSGLYEMPELEVIEEVTVDTPFGKPSDSYVYGRLGGVELYFLSRHGRGHRLGAPDVNYRANIYGFKSLGVDAIISVNAVGSMRDDYQPTEIVVPDQFYDNTRGRKNTFFDDALSVHVDVADPICPVLSGALYASGKKIGAVIHRGACVLCIEGPSFSTRAESRIYRSWGVDLIGMTLSTEAKLAREAEICYASLSLVTDYDVWKETSQDVTADLIISNLLTCANTAKGIIRETVSSISESRPCKCRSALETAIVTAPQLVPVETRQRLSALLGKYLPPPPAE